MPVSENQNGISIRNLRKSCAVPGLKQCLFKEFVDGNSGLAHSPRVFRKLGYILMVFAVISATGTHWLALQSVAWTTMLAENLQSNSLHDAFERTFDGKHPCCLCRQIAAAKKAEKKSDAQLEVKKIDYFCSNLEFAFFRPSAFYETGAYAPSLIVRTRAPAVPPPKELLG